MSMIVNANANAQHERVLTRSQHALIDALELVRLELLTQRKAHEQGKARRRRPCRAVRT
jgi:hypothetical protein